MFQTCYSAGKNEGPGKIERQQAKRTESLKKETRKAVHVMELPLRVCRLIQSIIEQVVARLCYDLWETNRHTHKQLLPIGT